jgi:hypothetical protein
MRNLVRQVFRFSGALFAGTIHDRLTDVELRLDDLRAHANQVESKIDYLIGLVQAQRQQIDLELQRVHSSIEELRSRLQDVSGRTVDLVSRTEHLAENDEVMLQSAIHLVERVQSIQNGR